MAEAFKNIRQLYKPMQPTVKSAGESVSYVECLPGEFLRDYIYCYWQLKTHQPLLQPFSYRVVADGCIDIFFEPGNPDESFVMGFCKEYTEFPLEHSFNYVGIRFLPTMFPQLFNVDASEISNRAAYLRSVIPAVFESFSNAFNSQQGLSDIKVFLDRYLSECIVNVQFNNDHRLYDAIALILKNQGAINIESGLQTGISPRQLRRLFQFYIGDSAKTFSKVVRFQNILKAKPSVQSLRNNKLFFDAGYYDQTHFIKEFKNFYGVTPTKAFGR